MADVMDLAQELFGIPVSCREALGELTVQYSIIRSSVGSEQQIERLIGSVPDRDKMTQIGRAHV